MTRIIIFTGKGGVGKSSVAAAHALHSAKEGKRTLLVSTDMAHNLSDMFEVSLGKEPKEVQPCLDLLEIDPNHVMEYDFPDMKRAIENLLGSAGMPHGDLSELTAFPGMDELFSLLKLLSIQESGVYERIMVDCAPTGETLALLKFPELLSWYMEKFFPVGKIAVRILSPLSKAVFKIELPDGAAMTDIEKMYVRCLKLQSLLRNREITSIRLVAIPEKMVVEETKRNFMYLNLYDFQVDGLFMNRLLPEYLENEFFDQWLLLQKKYAAQLEEVFQEIPIYRIPWFEQDLRGVQGIRRLKDAVLNGREVFALPKEIDGLRYEKTTQGYCLILPLPFAKKEEIQLHETPSDLIVRLGNYKRSIPKPDALRGFEVTGAKMEGGGEGCCFPLSHPWKGAAHERGKGNLKEAFGGQAIGGGSPAAAPAGFHAAAFKADWPGMHSHGRRAGL